MSSFVTKLVCGLTLAALCCVPALAAGPVDGEFASVWWANDLETDTGTGTTETDGSAPGFQAELWVVDRYGVRASQFTSDSDAVGAGDAEYTSLDVMWRPFAPSKNNHFAFGVGWQQSDLGNVFVGDGETSGLRFSVEGGVGIVDAVFAYGTASWAPELEDSTDSLGGHLDDLEGYEAEVGVGWKVAPWISFKAGYRLNSIDFTQTTATVAAVAGSLVTTTTTGGVIGFDSGPEAPNPNAQMVMTSNSGSVESSGFFFGLGFRF